MSKIKLDETDHDILEMLIENTRTPFTDIAKKLNISVQSIYAKKRPSINFIRQFCDLMNCYIVTDGYTYNILDK
jgi:predicted DNA-binding ArsR family transcriptional regulator